MRAGKKLDLETHLLAFDEPIELSPPYSSNFPALGRVLDKLFHQEEIDSIEIGWEENMWYAQLEIISQELTVTFIKYSNTPEAAICLVANEYFKGVNDGHSSNENTKTKKKRKKRTKKSSTKAKSKTKKKR